MSGHLGIHLMRYFGRETPAPPGWSKTPPTEPGYYPVVTGRVCCSEHPRKVWVVRIGEPEPGYPSPAYHPIEQCGTDYVFTLESYQKDVAQGRTPWLWGPRIELPEPPVG